MESSIETILGIALFLLVLSWSLFSINIYLSANDEDKIGSILLEYAIAIRDNIISTKHLNDSVETPSFYKINAKIFIMIRYWIYIYEQSVYLLKNGTYPKNSSLPSFIGEAKALGAFMNSSYTLV